MARHYEPINQVITEERISRFDAFRATLPADEQRKLDTKLNRWIEIMNAHRKGFGIIGAKELFMSLCQFEESHQVKHERTPEHALP